MKQLIILVVSTFSLPCLLNAQGPNAADVDLLGTILKGTTGMSTQQAAQHLKKALAEENPNETENEMPQFRCPQKPIEKLLVQEDCDSSKCEVMKDLHIGCGGGKPLVISPKNFGGNIVYSGRKGPLDLARNEATLNFNDQLRRYRLADIAKWQPAAPCNVNQVMKLLVQIACKVHAQNPIDLIQITSAYRDEQNNCRVGGVPKVPGRSGSLHMYCLALDFYTLKKADKLTSKSDVRWHKDPTTGKGTPYEAKTHLSAIQKTAQEMRAGAAEKLPDRTHIDVRVETTSFKMKGNLLGQ